MCIGASTGPRCTVAWLLLASLASPAAAAKWSLWHQLFGKVEGGAPPWSAEAPGAAGRRFGLGLDLFFEHQESLRITSMEQTIQTRDLLTGREDIQTLRTDPGLLNRKFDLVWEQTGIGIQPAIALPSIGLPRALRLYPTLVVQAATADVSLDFHDSNRPSDSSSLSGRGPLFGAGLDLTTALCQGCPWFAGASYGFQKLPSLSADRSPRFGPQGFEVLEDEVRLSRDVQEVSGRVGYGFTGNRVVSYLGVRHRWTDLDIADHLRYRDPFQEVETGLDSRTRLESAVTLGVAGVEARLGPRLFGRVETSVGEGDWGVGVRVMYLPTARPDKPFDFTAFAALIAPQLAQLEAEFQERRRGLTVSPNGAYVAKEVDHLLSWTEGRLFKIFEPNQVAPLRAAIKVRFWRFRRELSMSADAAGNSSSFLRTEVVLAAYQVASSLAKTQPVAVVDAVLNRLSDMLRLLTGIARENRLTLRLCIESSPYPRATFLLVPPEYAYGNIKDKSQKPIPNAVVGYYDYTVSYESQPGKKRFRPITCSGVFGGCLDLLREDVTGDRLFKCDFAASPPSCKLLLWPSEGCKSQ